MDEQKPGGDQPDSPQASAPIPPAAVAEHVEGASAGVENKDAKKDHPKTKQAPRPVPFVVGLHLVYRRVAAFIAKHGNATWFNILLTGIIVFGTVGQYCAFRDSNRIARKAAEDTIREMQAANVAAKEIAANALVAQAEQAEKDRVLTLAALTQAQTNATIGQELTRKSLSANQSAVEAAQRARVVITEALPYELVVGGKENARFRMKNSGYVTATEVRVWTGLSIRAEPLPDPALIDRSIPVYSTSVLAAGDTQIVRADLSKIEKGGFNDFRIKAIQEGRMTLYVYLVGTYLDGFKRRRNFGSCWQHDASGKDWQICSNNNWAD